MPNMDDLCHLPAHQLVRLMSVGAVSCREVMQAHLARIDAVNPSLNALIEAADPQQCLELADDADNLRTRGGPLGRAHGLPVVVKDVMRVAGLACSGGSPALRAVATDDATAVARLRAEGAIVLGLTNVPEMGRGGETNNNLYGRTNNPFDLSRTPGGSRFGRTGLGRWRRAEHRLRRWRQHQAAMSQHGHRRTQTHTWPNSQNGQRIR
jgi:amidase